MLFHYDLGLQVTQLLNTGEIVYPSLMSSAVICQYVQIRTLSTRGTHFCDVFSASSACFHVENKWLSNSASLTHVYFLPSFFRLQRKHEPTGRYGGTSICGAAQVRDGAKKNTKSRFKAQCRHFPELAGLLSPTMCLQCLDRVHHPELALAIFQGASNQNEEPR